VWFKFLSFKLCRYYTVNNGASLYKNQNSPKSASEREAATYLISGTTLQTMDMLEDWKNAARMKSTVDTEFFSPMKFVNIKWLWSFSVYKYFPMVVT
jgi:hypothetical protein